MNKNDYKELIGDLLSENSKLEKENLKLREALCNLRDEYLDMGGDPNQLELFDKDDVSQLNIFESPDGGKTVYKRNAGDYDNKTKVIKLHDEKS